MRSLLFLVFSIFSFSILANPSILVNSLDDALSLQKEINNDIVLIFSSQKCSFCQKLKNDLSKSNIENKIICIIDIDRNHDAKKQYKVSVIPDTRIISKGKETKKIIGYKNKETYLDSLK